MYLAGREWIGIGRERTGLDWTGADSTEWTGPHVSGVDWTGLSRTALQKTGLDGTALHRTGLHCITLDWTGKYHTAQDLLALDSRHCCIPACGHGYFLMKDSSPALIRTEPRGPTKKKKTKLVAIKTCRPYLFQMTCSADQPQLFFTNCSMQRLKVFLSANAPILHKLVSHCFSSLLTFLVMESRWKQAYLELQKVRMSQDLKSEKRPALLLY